ncbi:RNA-binding protein 44 isoform X2 [Syngnathus scovelli]|uniref:RNA-binding protein 44 isoform X2 n=1 Tax=Syngnathus scovelli TaxID=161590 RepID=UPI002110A9D2|nr:RNA-binding protein 44 isoform X2 [Syngnathus scovelli]
MHKAPLAVLLLKRKLFEIYTSCKIDSMAYVHPIWPSNPVILQLQRRTCHLVDCSNAPSFDHRMANATKLREPDLRPTASYSIPANTQKFFLQISFYNFVVDHPNIALCDPKLTAWRMSLPSDYSQLVQDEEAFFHFLQEHPALELAFQQACPWRAPRVILQTTPTWFNEIFSQKHWLPTASNITYNRPQMERPTYNLRQCQGSAQSSACGVVEGLPGFTMDLEQPCRLNNSAIDVNLQFERQQDEMELQPKPKKGLLGDEIRSSNNTHLPEQSNVQMSTEGTKEEISTVHRMENMNEKSSNATMVQENSSVIFAVKKETAQSKEAHFLSEAATSREPKEFTELKEAQEMRSKQEKSQHHHQGKECECVGRAQKAELSVLALQYHMHRQYCRNGHLPGKSPDKITAVLKKLESDYTKMREEILAGIPLDQLQPLTVDCDECLAQRKPKMDCSKGACKELNTGEVWDDAEENLDPASIPAELKDQSGEMSDVNTELAKEEEMTTGLGLLNVANNVTKKSFSIRSTPTAKTTVVSLQYGTMAAFDTLMAELTHFHPRVPRWSIVDALEELWDTYQSDLWPLPLTTIRQMASDLLTRPANVTPP